MKLEASGSVEGVLTDDMAMSEYQGNLRIATTKTAYGIEKVTDDIDGERSSDMIRRKAQRITSFIF